MRRSWFLAFILSVLPAFILPGCGAGGGLAIGVVGRVLETTIDLTVAPAVRDAVSDEEDGYRAYLVWLGVAGALDEVVIPLASGENPELESIQSWFDEADLWSELPISDTEVRLFQDGINLIFSYIPADKWEKSEASGTIAGDVQLAVVGGLEALRDAMYRGIREAGYSTVGAAGSQAEEGVVNEVTPASDRVRFGYGS